MLCYFKMYSHYYPQGLRFFLICLKFVHKKCSADNTQYVLYMNFVAECKLQKYRVNEHLSSTDLIVEYKHYNNMHARNKSTFCFV